MRNAPLPGTSSHKKTGTHMSPKTQEKMSISEEKDLTREHFMKIFYERLERASKMTPEEMKMTYRGILYPSIFCTPENFQAMDALEAKEDDVLIMTYPKCGTNWTFRILEEMLTALNNKKPTLAPALEFEMPGKYQFLSQQPSPRLISSHLTYENIPKSFFEKTKILIIVRNPKDAAVSFFHFYNQNPSLPTYESWEKFFKDFASGNVMYGSFFDYYLGWEKQLDEGNLLVLTFEDMKADLPAQVRKICDFYGFSMTEEQINLVQEKTTFASMKDKSSETHGSLANALFRKGEVGDWKSLFTEEQSQTIDALYEKHLAATRIGKMINYGKYCTY